MAIESNWPVDWVLSGTFGSLPNSSFQTTSRHGRTMRGKDSSDQRRQELGGQRAIQHHSTPVLPQVLFRIVHIWGMGQGACPSTNQTVTQRKKLINKFNYV